jgi:hypothetical protein
MPLPADRARRQARSATILRPVGANPSRDSPAPHPGPLVMLECPCGLHAPAFLCRHPSLLRLLGPIRHPAANPPLPPLCSPLRDLLPQFPHLQCLRTRGPRSVCAAWLVAGSFAIPFRLCLFGRRPALGLSRDRPVFHPFGVRWSMLAVQVALRVPGRPDAALHGTAKCALALKFICDALHFLGVRGGVSQGA